MAKNSKEAYKAANEQFLKEMSARQDVRELTKGYYIG